MSTSYRDKRLDDQHKKKFYVKLYFKQCEEFWKTLIISIIKNRYVARYPRDKRKIIIADDCQRKLIAAVDEEVQHRIEALDAFLPDGQKIEMKAIKNYDEFKRNRLKRPRTQHYKYNYNSPPPKRRTPSPRGKLRSHKKRYREETPRSPESIPETIVYNRNYEETQRNSRNYNYDVSSIRSVSPDVSINNSMSWEEGEIE